MDEEEEKRAALVMSRLHLRFNPSSAMTIVPTQSFSLQPSPRAKDSSIQVQDSASFPLLTFPEWYTEGYSAPSQVASVYQPTEAHTHSGRPATQWKRRIAPAGPYGSRMLGSRVKDSPHTGVMFAPAKGSMPRQYWSFLPTSVLKRHPQLTK